ncbi:hypothetical protein FG386_002877 [Cryptosporidium ryanae]|uniref:uncharacterized protein n=1 Tax=Cryptosporidium ryanae TaxID=515981 RepID=UPI00351A882B|nr:hypothetical protein FG386_002877 [Cryptosporidium ryanae]
MSEYCRELLEKDYTLESWQTLALYLYSEREYSKCSDLLRECVEKHRILEDSRERKGGDSAESAKDDKHDIKTVSAIMWMLNILDLNIALENFESNTRTSETLVRECEERTELFSRLYEKRYSGNYLFASTVHKCRGYIYFYKSVLMNEIDFNLRNALLDKSQLAFEKALEANSNDVLTISGMANVLYQKGSYSRSLRLFSLIMLLLGSNKCPNTTRLAMACCYLRLGRPKRASECCRRGIYVCIENSIRGLGEGTRDANPSSDKLSVSDVFPDSDGSVINTEFFKSELGERLINKLSSFERQTLADLLMCLFKAKEVTSRSQERNIVERNRLFELIRQVYPAHPALLIYKGDVEFFVFNGGEDNNCSTDRDLGRMSKRSTNFYCKLRSKYQIARKQHKNLDLCGASQNYLYILNSIENVNKAEHSLLGIYLSALYGLIKINVKLRKWDLVYQHTQTAFETIGIKSSNDLNSLKEYSLPIGYICDIVLLTISFVIISIEDKTSIPRNISIFSQLTVEERLLSCLHYIFFLLDRIFMDNNGAGNNNLFSHRSGYMIYLLLHKVVLALLIRGRKSLRRTDYNYKIIPWLISNYTSYKCSLNPIPLSVLLSACLSCMLDESSLKKAGNQDSFMAENFPDNKCRQFVKDNLGLYFNNLGVCLLECVTSISMEHSKLFSEQTLLNSAQKLFRNAREWVQSKANSDKGNAGSTVVFAEAAIRFNSAICSELGGYYANANDEYKRLSQDHPWFTASWLRRASLALERRDLQLAAQYCELSLSAKLPDLSGGNLDKSKQTSGKSHVEYNWTPGLGNSPEAANLLLAHIYSCQKKLDKSFASLSKVVKSKNSHFSNIGKIFLGLALYNKAKSNVQAQGNAKGGSSGFGTNVQGEANGRMNHGEFLMNNQSSVQSRIILSEVLRFETYNYIASNLITIQAAESGLVEPSMELWKHMLDVSGALEGTAVTMNYISLVNLGVLNAVLLTVSTHKYPPPTQHNLTLSSIVDENSSFDRRNEVLGSHPNFAEQRRILKTAVKLFQQALALDPTEKILHLSLIRCCFDMNLWEDARRLLEKATVRWPSDITFRIGLTYCLERLIYSEMGDMERAKHPGRVKYWMMLCETVGSFYHWLAILKETFQVTDMKFINQVKFNRLSIFSLQKYVPGVVRYNQDASNTVQTTNNKDDYKYKLSAFPPEGADLLPNVSYLTKQELIVSRKLRSRFEELLPIVEQVYEKEQRDVEELIIRSEDFRKKQEEEIRRKEEEERANIERVKLLSIELGKEAESIAASLPDSNQAERRRTRKEASNAEDGYGDDYDDVNGDSDGDSVGTVKSNASPDSEFERDSDSSNGKDNSDSEMRSESKSRTDNSGKKSKARKPKDSKGGAKESNRKPSKREEKRMLKLKRLQEQTAALLELSDEVSSVGDRSRLENDDGSNTDKVKSRLKKRRLEDDSISDGPTIQETPNFVDEVNDKQAESDSKLFDSDN